MAKHIKKIKNNKADLILVWEYVPEKGDEEAIDQTFRIILDLYHSGDKDEKRSEPG